MGAQRVADAIDIRGSLLSTAGSTSWQTVSSFNPSLSDQPPPRRSLLPPPPPNTSVGDSNARRAWGAADRKKAEEEEKQKKKMKMGLRGGAPGEEEGRTDHGGCGGRDAGGKGDGGGTSGAAGGLAGRRGEEGKENVGEEMEVLWGGENRERMGRNERAARLEELNEELFVRFEAISCWSRSVSGGPRGMRA